MNKNDENGKIFIFLLLFRFNQFSRQISNEKSSHRTTKVSSTPANGTLQMIGIHAGGNQTFLRISSKVHKFLSSFHVVDNDSNICV